MKKIFLHWKIIFVVCSIIYMGWLIQVGGNEFDRINSQFHRLADQLEPEMIRVAALEELATECRRELRQQKNPDEQGCSSWPSAVVAAKEKEVAESRLRARERGLIKVVLFYAGFVVFFLVGPVVLTYMIIVGIILLFKNIKIVR